MDLIRRLTEKVDRLEAEVESIRQAAMGGTTVTTPVRIVDPEGRPVGTIFAGDLGAGLSLFDSDGYEKCRIGVSPDRTGHLTIRDEAGEVVAALQASGSSGRLVLRDPSAPSEPDRS